MADSKGWTDDAGEDDPKSEAKGRGRRPRNDDDNAKAQSKPTVQQGWGSPSNTAPDDSFKKASGDGEEEDADDEDKKGRRRARWDDENVSEILIIPDLEEEAEEDITTQVAAAPRNTAKRVQSLRELEHDLKMTVSSSVNGIDLSLLTAHLVPAEMLIEADVPWDFDSLLQEVTQEFNAQAEKRPPAEATEDVGAKPGETPTNALVRDRSKKNKAEDVTLDDDVASRLDAMLNSKPAMKKQVPNGTEETTAPSGRRRRVPK